jgi:hypothetical protein
VLRYKVGSSKEAPSKAERLVVVDMGEETSLAAAMLMCQSISKMYRFGDKGEPLGVPITSMPKKK